MFRGKGIPLAARVATIAFLAVWIIVFVAGVWVAGAALDAVSGGPIVDPVPHF